MGSKTYKFTHDADVAVLVNELQKDLTQQARKSGMTLVRQGRSWSLRRSGADLNVTVTPLNVEITVALSWFAEAFRGRIEAGLGKGLPKLLAKCERLSRTSRSRRS